MFYVILCHEKSWMTCDSASLQQFFMAYQEILRVKMKGCVDSNSVYSQDLGKQAPGRSQLTGTVSRYYRL